MARMSVKTKRVKIPRVNYKYAHGISKRAKKWYEEVSNEAFIAIVEEMARRDEN